MIKFIILLFNFILLFGGEVKVFGEKSYTKGNFTTIYDSLLFKDTQMLSANKIVYDKNNSIVDAYGNVYMNYDKSDYILSNHLKLDLNNSQIKAYPFFLFNYKDNSWINSENAMNESDKYYAQSVVTSTCRVNTPDWKIVSTSVDYNKTSKWLNLYNPVLYVKDVPVFYMPYLGFSLNKERRSGFLRPLFGYSSTEGLLLTFPYFQTLGEAADLELDPTSRSMRGQGIYSTFRFVHSKTSSGEFKIGEFRDKLYYQEKYNLANQVHRGWSFKYNNSEILDESDKLYVSLKNANDTDYFYLDSYNYNFHTGYDSILTSKVNYYVRDDYNYLGIYTKYFKDTTKLSNADTMQVLPQINYHRFNDSFWNNFSYSIDTNIYNYTRRTGSKEVKKTASIPVNYNVNFFDDYIKLGVTERFSMTQITTNDGNVSKYSTTDTIVKLYSNLSKDYTTFIHNISPSISFGMNNEHHFNGNDDTYLAKSALQKSITLNLDQYLVADEWNINHSVSQTFYLDNNTTKYSDIINTVSMNYQDYYMNDKTTYAPSTNDITYNIFVVGYDNKEYKLEYKKLYKKSVDSSDRTRTYDFNGYYKFDNVHKVFGEYNYDEELKLQKFYLLGLSMKKKCWNYSISYKKEISPILTNDGVSSLVRKTIYFEVELVPLGGVKQQYQLKTDKGEE